MDWESYKTIYYENAISSYLDMYLCILYTAPDYAETIKKVVDSLLDFKKSSKIRNPKNSNELTWLMEKLNNMDTGVIKKIKETYNNPNVIYYMFYIDIFKSITNSYKTAPDLDRTFISRELIMHFAYFVAFLSDSLRAICNTRPEVLKNSENTFNWEQIITCGSWEKILNKMTEDFIYDFGFLSIKKCINKIRNKFGILKQVPEEDIIVLEEASYVRNLLVHNGGRINLDYINKTGRKDFKIGALFPINIEYIETVFKTMQFLSNDLFFEISKKFFKKEEKDCGYRFIRMKQNF
jgi:hypothetical protein